MVILAIYSTLSPARTCCRVLNDYATLQQCNICSQGGLRPLILHSCGFTIVNFAYA